MFTFFTLLPPTTVAVLLLFAVVFGAVFGSFTNCLAWRVVSGESVLKGRSHCTTCGHTLGVLDLIPLVSWPALGGKCRYCGKMISPRYFIVELVTALAFALLLAAFGVSVQWVVSCALFCILLGLSLVDLDSYRIPNGFIVALVLLWVISLALLYATGTSLDALKAKALQGLLGSLAVGGGLLLFTLVFELIVKKKALGGGDIKLFFAVGLFLGLYPALLNLLVACIFGIVFALIPAKRSATEDTDNPTFAQRKIPFGPAISLATICTLLCGDWVISWYISLL